MKRLYLTLVSLFVAASVHAATISLSITPGTMTNIFSGSGLITGIQWTSTAGSATNSFVTVVDTPTNLTAYTQAAYTNIATYGTNYIWTYTNYFGVVTSLTNFVILDVSNAVSAATVNYPSATFATAGGTTFNANNPNLLVRYGLWATNTGIASQPGTLTITYIPR